MCFSTFGYNFKDIDWYRLNKYIVKTSMVYTDFDGKPTSFVPGREVPNKEPAMSKFVVEKLWCTEKGYTYGTYRRLQYGSACIHAR